MKIAFILPHGGRAGAVKSTVKAANGLLKRGHDVRLLVNNKMDDMRVRLRRLYWNIFYSGSSDWLNTFKATIETFSDIELCVFEKDETVIGSGWWAAKEMGRLNSPGIKRLYFVRSMPENINDMRAAWGQDVPKVAISSYLGEAVEKHCGQRIIAVVPNGIDTDEYYPSMADKQRDGIGTIFGISYHKDPETVLGVLKKLRNLCPETPHRVFGAAKRPKQISSRNYWRLPTLEKAREIYSRSLVWFLGSYSEGFGVPILEAMACGCAVVATDCGGPRDIIVDGENGFLVELGNVEQIVNKIDLLLEDSSLRQRFVEKSAITVANFSWDSSVNKLEQVLSNL